MTVEHRTGDLFAMPDLEAIGHGVNCKGKMGSGIAVVFRNTFPAMHKAYVKLCSEGKLQLGMVFPWHDEERDLWIFNMASQYYPGADARMDALLTTVDKVLAFCEKRNIRSIGLPQIGCGIGGLDWAEVAPAIEERARDSSVKVVLVTFG